ncbi:MAG: helix-turn-helix transcriptional regulator [Treponema sp.]|jgi:transcriptional regulator with XRE-family HTH domain|nr:helix-turn-helix transcriptional regulator [Treponema sp.]
MKERRRILGLSQAKLAEKVTTSTHYISQIEQENKFPSPEKLERIAAALEIDSPQLFSMNSFTDEAVERFQEGVLSDMGTAIAQAVDSRLNELKRLGLNVKADSIDSKPPVRDRKRPARDSKPLAIDRKRPPKGGKAIQKALSGNCTDQNRFPQGTVDAPQ